MRNAEKIGKIAEKRLTSGGKSAKIVKSKQKRTFSPQSKLLYGSIATDTKRGFCARYFSETFGVTLLRDP